MTAPSRTAPYTPAQLRSLAASLDTAFVDVDATWPEDPEGAGLLEATGFSDAIDELERTVKEAARALESSIASSAVR